MALGHDMAGFKTPERPIEECPMNRFTQLAIRAGIALAFGMAAAHANAQVKFTMTYKGGSTPACNTTKNISGAEPSAPGKYPVYVHIGGTVESYSSNWSKAAVNNAASKGFVAASIQYDNSSFGSCSTINQRAQCMFNPNNVNSAIAMLCSRAKADCSKGIVTGGLSQGSIISVLSRNFDSRIRASMGQGTGATYTAAYNLASCMADGKHEQPGSRLRIINGEKDMFVGGTQAKAAASAELVTGVSCEPGSQSCLQPNGSGWYVVKNNQVLDGLADHCFMGFGGVNSVQCSGLQVDANYLNGNEPWALNPTIDWLKAFVSP
jgi:hypothetical protein